MNQDHGRVHEANVKLISDTTEGAQKRSVLVNIVPNLLALTRLALGITFPLIPAKWRLAALLTAVVTEFLDGQVARLLHASSTSGRILDPVADKLFVVSVLATLLADGSVSLWQLILVMSRDIVVSVGAFCVAARRGISALKRMAPSPLGKLATAVQFLFLLALVTTREINLALLIVASILSAAAAIDYVRRFRRPVLIPEPDRTPRPAETSDAGPR
jgi:cardiolipin synthase (CMP-forming)